MSASDHFWNMTSAKGARDCSERSIAYKIVKKLRVSDHFWKMRSTNCARDCSESSIRTCQPHHQQEEHIAKPKNQVHVVVAPNPQLRVGQRSDRSYKICTCRAFLNVAIASRSKTSQLVRNCFCQPLSRYGVTVA